jgi:hypothetical protein
MRGNWKAWSRLATRYPLAETSLPNKAQRPKRGRSFVFVSIWVFLGDVAHTLPLADSFLPAKRVEKHPRLRVTSLDKNDQKTKRSPSPGVTIVHREREFTHTNTHIQLAMWVKGWVEFFHWQFQCPILNFLASAGFKLWLRIDDGDECAANMPTSNTLTTILRTDAKQFGLSTNSFCYSILI